MENPSIFDRVERLEKENEELRAWIREWEIIISRNIAWGNHTYNEKMPALRKRITPISEQVLERLGMNKTEEVIRCSYCGLNPVESPNECSKSITGKHNWVQIIDMLKPLYP
jgi:hypothetical protein